jgi:hypothetical protein
MRELDELNDLLVGLGDLGTVEADAAQTRERGRAALLREVARERAAAEQRPRRRRACRPRRRLVLALGVPLTVLALGAIGYAAFWTSSSVLSAGVVCHSDQRLDGSGAIFGLDGRRATAICAEAWRRGEVDETTHRIPPLRACIDPAVRGPIHVFATADPHYCERRKLTPAPRGGAGPDARRYAAFEHDAVRRLLQFRCAPATVARRIVTATLARHGLDDWRVDAAGFDAAHPCATLAIDSDERTVTLVPSSLP